MNTEEIQNEVERIEHEIREVLKQEKDLKGKIRYSQMSYKKFDEIYEKYGQEAYCKFVPRKYRKRDERVLIGEQRFLSLRNKHGEKAYKKHIDLIKSKNIERKTGSPFKGWLYRVKQDLKRLPLLVFPMVLVGTPMLDSSKIQQNEKKKVQDNIEKIEEYLGDVDKFGKEIREKNFSDIENVMYIMYDMWENTQGYGTPKYDLIQCAGLDLADSSGYGVCRNMADDTARKLNAINSDYNARTVSVYYQKGENERANIKIKKVKNNEESTNEIGISNESADAIARIISGNHAVVLFHSIEDDVELVCDPTNPGLGIIMNGKIKMFNETSENSYKEKYRPIGGIIEGAEKIMKIPYNYLSSIGIYSEDEKEYLQNKYGVEAQNKALESVKAAKPKSFYESIKVEESVLSANTNDKSRNEGNINKKEIKDSEITR